jgi:hypothetical protein
VGLRVQQIAAEKGGASREWAFSATLSVVPEGLKTSDIRSAEGQRVAQSA